MSSQSEREAKLIKAITDSGAINFEQLGKVMAQVAPQVIQSPPDPDSDYVFSVYSSFVKIFHWMPALAMENLGALREMAAQIEE